jgi:hypothetical protein
MNEWATAAYDLLTNHDKLNGHSHHEETAKATEDQDLGAKPQRHVLVR